MPSNPRPHRKSIRLSDAEKWFSETLSEMDGDSDDAAVFRRYMLKEARARGLVYPEQTHATLKKKNGPKH